MTDLDLYDQTDPYGGKNPQRFWLTKRSPAPSLQISFPQVCIVGQAGRRVDHTGPSSFRERAET